MGRRLRYTKWRNEQNLKRNSGTDANKITKAEAITAHILYTVSYNKFTFSQEYDMKTSICNPSITVYDISRTGTTVSKVI
jgi:Fe(3+) dicitrate transport protein